MKGDGSVPTLPVRAPLARTVVVLGLVLLAGCTTFSNVRSAEVKEGPSFSFHYTALPEPGEDAGYFWATGLDSCTGCSGEVNTLDLSARYGLRPDAADHAFELGAGLEGFRQIYVEGFAGLRQGTRTPLGLGVRLPVKTLDQGTGLNYRVDGRLDVILSRRVRLLANPGWLYHTRGSGMERSWLSAFVPGVGVQLSWAHVSITPSVAWIHARGHRGDAAARDLGLQDVTVSAPTFAVDITLHGRQ